MNDSVGYAGYREDAPISLHWIETGTSGESRDAWRQVYACPRFSTATLPNHFFPVAEEQELECGIFCHESLSGRWTCKLKDIYTTLFVFEDVKDAMAFKLRFGDLILDGVK